MALPVWPRAFGGAVGKGTIKATPADFQVDEILGFEPSGEGEHVFLWVEKSGLNTEQVADQLARYVKCARRQIGYAGLKDRHALARQWFCVHLPGNQDRVSWERFSGEGCRVLRWVKNQRKLKRGALAGNRFRLKIRSVSGEIDRLDDLLMRVKGEGLPNYFGPQRFGHDGGNLSRARDLFAGRLQVKNRFLRGLVLSAARALIFNELLAMRVSDGTWNRAIPGDLLMFDGSGAFFRADEIDDDINSRVASLRIHPSGPLWGQGAEWPSREAGAVERQLVHKWPHWIEGLEDQGLKGRRRPLRIRVQDLEWYRQANELDLCFALPSGSYATALVRELLDTEEG